MERAHVMKMLRYSFIGSEDTVKSQIKEFQELFNVDELMITAHIYEHESRLKSYEIFRNAVNDLVG